MLNYKISEQLGWTSNSPNAILKFRDFNPINKGTIGSMDRIQAIRAEDAIKIKDRIDSEMDNIDIEKDVDNYSDDKEKKYNDKEINAFGVPFEDIKDDPLTINSDDINLNREFGYPYGFGNINLHFSAGQNESLNSENIHKLGEILINQYYIWSNGGQSKFNLNLNKYLSTNTTLKTKFNNSLSNSVMFEIRKDYINFTIKCKDDEVLELINSEMDNLLYRLDRYKEDTIIKKKEMENLKDTLKYKKRLKSKHYRHLSKEWNDILHIEEICSNIDKYTKVTKEFMNNLNLNSRYEYYKNLTNSDIYKKVKKLSDIYDISEDSFIKDFKWDIDVMDKVDNELNSKEDILNDISKFYYNMDFSDMFKTNKIRWKSIFNKYDREIKDFSNEIFR